MAAIIQIRRGTALEWTTADPTLANGEMGYETDTFKFKFGDGSTVWTLLNYHNEDILSLTDLSDVDLTGSPLPTIDDILIYDGSEWVQGQIPDAANSLNDLTDVDLTGSPAVQLGDNLTYDGSQWIQDSTIYKSLAFYNGTTATSASITVTSNGTTILANVEDAGGGDFQVWLDNVLYTFTATSIALTAGTDTVPVRNYVFIQLSGGIATLATNTTGFPNAFGVAHVGDVYCQSAASLQNDGALKMHAWTDHIVGTDDQGHVSHINEWIRNQQATWRSGVAPVVSITVNGGAADNVFFSSSLGNVLQLHNHTFPAMDMDGAPAEEMYVINDFTTPFNRITDMNVILADSAGVSMSGRIFNLVVWGVINESEDDCKLFVNLPTESYASNKPQNAIDDTAATALYAVPSTFIGVGFLIARITLEHNVGASGTWTLHQTEDLRGLTPNTAAGAGGGGGSITDHSLLSNLLADDHTQYLLVDGTRAMGAALDMGTFAITNVGDVDGVDVSALSTTTTNHIADSTIHFTEGSIVHQNISGAGTNDHAAIDSHISDSTIHFSTLTGLSDVVLGSPILHNALVYDGTQWVNDIGVQQWMSCNKGDPFSTPPITTGGDDGIAIGDSAEASAGGISIGSGADGNVFAIAIGTSAHAPQGNGIAIGTSAQVSSASATSMAIGVTAECTSGAGVSIAFGHGVTNTVQESARIGNETISTNILHLRDEGNLTLEGAKAQFVQPNYAGSPALPVGTEGGTVYDSTTSTLKLYDGAAWVHVGLQNITNENLGDLNDVTVPSPGLDDVLVWDIPSSKWINDTLVFIDLEELADVTITSVTSDDILTYSGTEWVNSAPAAAPDLGDLGDVTITSPATGAALVYNGSIWVDGVPTAGTLGGLSDVTITSPATGASLTYSGSAWIDGDAEYVPLSILTSAPSYTLQASDAGNYVAMNAATGTTLTVPTNSSVAFAVGTEIIVQQIGVGTTTIAGAGITFQSAGGLLSLAGQYSAVTLIKKATDTWTVIGDLA